MAPSGHFFVLCHSNGKIASPGRDLLLRLLPYLTDACLSQVKSAASRDQSEGGNQGYSALSSGEGGVVPDSAELGMKPHSLLGKTTSSVIGTKATSLKLGEPGQVHTEHR